MSWLAGRRPADLGVVEGRLGDCPASPNCVCSDASRGNQRVPELALRVPPSEAWAALREVLAGWPRTRIVSDTGSYLHAECQSAWLGFVDDLEVLLRGEPARLALRSASRLGHSDLGANRRRVDSLARELAQRAVVEGP